jgi:hypothetical protein
MLASCTNCANRQGNVCVLGLKPAKGEILCEKYAMSEAFRNMIVARLRQDIAVEVSQAYLKIKIPPKPAGEAYAG